VAVPRLFVSSGGKHGGNYLEWRSQNNKKEEEEEEGRGGGGGGGEGGGGGVEEKEEEKEEEEGRVDQEDHVDVTSLLYVLNHWYSANK